MLHPKTRTLIVADLVENIRASPHWWTQVILRAGGIYGRVGFSRLFRFLYTNRPQARASLERVLVEDFDKVLLAHGDPIPHGGKEALRLAYSWL